MDRFEWNWLGCSSQWMTWKGASLCLVVERLPWQFMKIKRLVIGVQDCAWICTGTGGLGDWGTDWQLLTHPQNDQQNCGDETNVSNTCNEEQGCWEGGCPQDAVNQNERERERSVCDPNRGCLWMWMTAHKREVVEHKKRSFQMNENMCAERDENFLESEICFENNIAVTPDQQGACDDFNMFSKEIHCLLRSFFLLALCMSDISRKKSTAIWEKAEKHHFHEQLLRATFLSCALPSADAPASDRAINFKQENAHYEWRGYLWERVRLQNIEV